MDERGHHLEEGADKRLRCTRCVGVTDTGLASERDNIMAVTNRSRTAGCDGTTAVSGGGGWFSTSSPGRLFFPLGGRVLHRSRLLQRGAKIGTKSA